jgi:cytidyltransferase-like protein
LKICSRKGGIRTKWNGIFLGRMQPLYEGHKYLLRMIFEENDEVIICVGSAQSMADGDPKERMNPLHSDERILRVEKFIREEGLAKPYRFVPVEDIDSDAAWPSYLASAIGLDADDINRIYFGDKISDSYSDGLIAAGFSVVLVKRKRFKHRAPDSKIFEVGCATDLRHAYEEHDLRI